MLALRLQSLRGPRLRADECVWPSAYKSIFRPREARFAPYVTVSDPRHPAVASTIRLAHPKDPSQVVGSSSASSSLPSASPPSSSTEVPDSQSEPPHPTPKPPSDGTPPPELSGDPTPGASVPARFVHPPVNPHTDLPFLHSGPHATEHLNPPFNTYRFFSVLEHSFPTVIARDLMRATRALLVDRLGRVKRDALTRQDLESVSLAHRVFLYLAADRSYTVYCIASVSVQGSAFRVAYGGELANKERDGRNAHCDDRSAQRDGYTGNSHEARRSHAKT